MKKFIVIAAIVIAVGWYGNSWYKQKGQKMHGAGLNLLLGQFCTDIWRDIASFVNRFDLSSYKQKTQKMIQENPVSKPGVSNNSGFKCDGRTHCSQMTSCEEAMFFLKNCPGVKMDGDNDGIPCENQWCR